jgi:hypothetical protein
MGFGVWGGARSTRGVCSGLHSTSGGSSMASCSMASAKGLSAAFSLPMSSMKSGCELGSLVIVGAR